MEAIQNIGLFIDHENLRHNYEYDIEPIMDFLKGQGNIVLRKAYADWGRYAKDKIQMVNSGIETINLPSKGYAGKNSSDIRLVIDVMETTFQSDNIDTFAIISGDSDFVSLVVKLRVMNKRVIVVGRNKQTTSHLLYEHANKFILYENLVQEKIKGLNIISAYELLLRTIEGLQKKSMRTSGSQVKQFMKRADRFFDERQFGFSRFKRFLEFCKNEGVICLEKAKKGGDYLVYPKIRYQEIREQLKPSGSPVLDMNNIDLSQILPFNRISNIRV